MTYVGYARRFRPQRFEEIVGQESVVLTLRHALEGGRASHAYLFTGPRGVGKTTTARILAKALNCERGASPDPCDECARCREIAGGGSLDVIEIDAASHNSVDDVRELRDAAYNATHGSRFRLYILDEVHMLSGPAFNALLKILEEPPSHVKFVLCTTDPQKVPETVRSRCQRLDFRPIAVPQVVERLGQIAGRENLDIPDDALRSVALHVRGSMRDAEILLEQLSVYSSGSAGGAITAEDVRALTGAVDEAKVAGLCTALARGDAAAVLVQADSMIEAGTDTVELIDATLAHLRGALTVQACGVSAPLVASRGIDTASAKETASALTQEELLYAAAALGAARRDTRSSEQPRILLELALVRLSRVKELVSLEELAARIKETGTARGGEKAGEARGAGAGREAPAYRRQGASRTARPRSAAREPSRAASAADESPFTVEEEPAVETEAPLGPPLPPVEGELTLEAVERRWRHILRNVFDKSYPVGVLTRPAAPTRVDDDIVELTYPEGHSGYYKSVNTKEKLALVESAASEIIGRPVRVSLTSSAADGDRAGGAQNPSSHRPSPSGERGAHVDDAVNDPGVRRLLDRFDGQVLRVERGAHRPAGSSGGRGAPDGPASGAGGGETL